MLIIHLKDEIELAAENLVDEASVPLLPASKIGSGILREERIPSSVARVRDVYSAIQAALSGASDPDQHLFLSDIGGLSEALDGKAPAVHTHSLAQVVGLETVLATIANALATLPIVSATAPSSPATGQRWLDTTDRLIWFWSGSYWLSEQVFHASTPYSGISSVMALGHFAVRPGYNLFLLSFTVSGYANGTNDANNFWALTLDRRTASGEYQEAVIYTNTGIAAGQRFRFISTLNLHRDAIALGVTSYRVAFYDGNAPGQLSHGTSETYYRLAKP